MGGVNEYELEMMSELEKSAYFSLSLSGLPLIKRKTKKNRKYESCRTDRTLELFPDFPSD